MEKYVKALKKHWYVKKQRDEIFAKIKNCNISLVIKSLPIPYDCHSCQWASTGVDDRRCLFADLCLDNTSVSRGERLPYCPLEIRMVLDGNVL
jgi:hypothetical protein